MIRTKLVTGFTGVALSAVAVFGLSGAMASATNAGATGATGVTTTTSVSSGTVATQKLQLEQQLAERVTQLQHLSSDVSGAKSLTPGHAATLNARISTEQSSINALVVKVPTDTTKAEIRADRAAMLQDNRVYAVMTPQVIEMIEADGVATEVATLQANEPALESEVASLSGMPGFNNATNHYNAYVKRLSNWSTKIASLETVILAQSPSGYPKNTKVFVAANHEILNANVALAYAQYDASVIALATGGYTGS